MVDRGTPIDLVVSVGQTVSTAPTITSSPAVSGTERQLYTYDVDATDPDAGELLIFSLDVKPTGMSIDSGSGLIEWTPSAGQAGAHDITVRVTDLTDLFVTQSYELNVVAADEGPTITSQPVTTATQDQLYTYLVEATDSDVGDLVSFSMEQAPDGMTIDSGSGLVQWTPNSGQVGPSDVTVRVEDPGGLFNTQDFSVNVQADDRSPRITSTPVTAATQGQLYSYDVEATDPNVGDVLSFSFDQSPQSMSIGPDGGPCAVDAKPWSDRVSCSAGEGD